MPRRGRRPCEPLLDAERTTFVPLGEALASFVFEPVGKRRRPNGLRAAKLVLPTKPPEPYGCRPSVISGRRLEKQAPFIERGAEDIRAASRLPASFVIALDDRVARRRGRLGLDGPHPACP